VLKNYFKIAWRNLVKNKGYSAINIGGLTIGMAVAILIGLWIQDELSHNKYHKNYGRIARVMQNANFNGRIESGVANPALMGPALRARFGSDFKYVVQASWEGGQLLSMGNKSFNKHGIYLEPDGPEMLSLEMLKGTRQGLKDPYSILLSASAAKTLFGDEDPMNKIIKLNRTYDIKVTGVYTDLPDNTTFNDVKVILPWDLWLIDNKWAKDLENPWGSNFSQTFVQVADNADMNKVSSKIANLKMDNISPEEKRFQWKVFLHPMSKWNLYSEFKNGVNKGGNIKYVWLFGMIGIFVLILACINFMNLSTARSEKRAREVGIRKTIGSMRWQLIRQFIAESYVVVLFAFVLAIIAVALLLPLFNDIAGKKMLMPWSNISFWITGALFMLVTGLLAGSYPAFYLSSFKPLKVLKGTFKAGKNAALPRQILVVVQFTVSVMLIIGTIIVYQQIQYAKDRPIGYTRHGLINMNFEKEIKEHFDAIKTELKNAGAIEDMAASHSPMTEVWNSNGGFDWEGKDPNLGVNFPNIRVSLDYGKTVKWDIKDGRDFSQAFATDSAAFIINESAAKFLGFKEPVGKTVKWDGRPYTVIAVVKDIMQESPFYPVRPTFYYLDNYEFMFNLIIRLNPNKSVSSSIAAIENIMKKYTPDIPFNYKFVDETFGSKFSAEERIGKLSSYFAVLAVFISCLGLLGMSGFVAEQRTKEIGIRKVLGASVVNLWRLLSLEFVVLVVLACIIATPIAYYYLNNWLTNYDYRIKIGWQVFVLASVMSLIITMLTVSFLTIKAALANPVRSLRTE
jgi:putative ABC transport system permease protein